MRREEQGAFQGNGVFDGQHLGEGFEMKLGWGGKSFFSPSFLSPFHFSFSVFFFSFYSLFFIMFLKAQFS